MNRRYRRAAWICLFFGHFGLHRFYLGKWCSGLFMLLTLGGLGLWTIGDWLWLLSRSRERLLAPSLQQEGDPEPI